MKRIALALALALGCDGPKETPAPVASDAGGASTPPAIPASPSAPVAAEQKSVPNAIAAQHVLVTYKGAKGAPKNTVRSKADAKKRAEEVVTKAKAGADFSDLAKEYSEDPGSRERMGSVGKFTRDKMTKPFSDAAFGLAVDQVSGVVESEFGFHVIKRNQ